MYFRKMRPALTEMLLAESPFPNWQLADTFCLKRPFARVKIHYDGQLDIVKKLPDEKIKRK